MDFVHGYHRKIKKEIDYIFQWLTVPIQVYYNPPRPQEVEEQSYSSFKLYY